MNFAGSIGKSIFLIDSAVNVLPIYLEKFWTYFFLLQWEFLPVSRKKHQ